MMSKSEKPGIAEMTEALDAIIGKYQDYKTNLISILQKPRINWATCHRTQLVILRERQGSRRPRFLAWQRFTRSSSYKPTGKHNIMICKGTACHVKGAGAVEKAVFNHLGIEDGDTTATASFPATVWRAWAAAVWPRS
jgi:NADH:ubiquinone oxidoreductase subunit E